MSTMIHHQPTQSTWGMGPYGRMSSVEELDSSLNLLSRHNSRKGLPLMTPPGTPLVARSPESRFDYSPKSPQQPEPVAHIPPNTPVTPLLTPLTVVASHDFGEVEACSPRSSGNGISKAAIDNKIEQAMDLVKTHLTFAVREEVETLRVTIAELELKVASLESENQLLRQYAPVEVVSQLPSLVQQQKSTTAPPQPSAATLPLSPPKVPAGFCSSTFATTLNNVVGDVRQEMAMAAQNNTQQEQEGGN